MSPTGSNMDEILNLVKEPLDCSLTWDSESYIIVTILPSLDTEEMINLKDYEWTNPSNENQKITKFV